MTPFTVKRNDSGRVLEATLGDPETGVPSDLSGCTVLFVMKHLTTGTVAAGDHTHTIVGGVTVSGSATPTLAVTGTTTVSGTNTGDQTTITGNAGTATKLATARAINGVHFVATATYNGTNGLLRKNGTGEVSMSSSGSFAITKYGISAKTDGSSLAGAFQFAEILVYSTALSTGDREAVENYLGAKYGITITH